LQAAVDPVCPCCRLGAVRWYSRLRSTAALQGARRGHFHVTIISYDLARNNKEALMQLGWDLVVLDEVHRVKEPLGLTAVALRELMQPCRRRIGLSGAISAGIPGPNQF
jgi:superfamily II DNA or RNA helicase